VYFTDRGLDELEDARGDERVAIVWLVDRMREFIDLNPEHEVTVDRFASHLARVDDDGDGDGAVGAPQE
jgi:hypothetical protein